MERAEVKSSLLRSIAYDAEKKIVEVEFHPRKPGQPGKVYQYADVPLEAWKEWGGAKSLGGHFLKYIKPNYVCTPVAMQPESAT
jgi:KTSC domain